MTVVRIDINLQRDKPMEISYAQVERDSKKYLYISRPGKKPRPLARASLHKPIMESPTRGHYFVLSWTDDRPAIRQSQAVQLGILQLLEELEARMQRCAVRLNEAMEEAYVSMEGEHFPKYLKGE